MSVYASAAAWSRANVKGAALLLLVSLADQANDEGIAWPKIETIAARIRMSEAHTHRLLRHLAACHELTVQQQLDPEGRNIQNRYVLTPGGEGVARDTPRVSSRAAPRVSPATPRTVMNAKARAREGIALPGTGETVTAASRKVAADWLLAHPGLADHRGPWQAAAERQAAG